MEIPLRRRFPATFERPLDAAALGFGWLDQAVSLPLPSLHNPLAPNSVT